MSGRAKKRPSPRLPKNTALDLLLSGSRGRLSHLLGIKLVSLSSSMVRASMPHRRPATQSAGLLHGGALAALADTTAAIGVLASLPKGSRAVTAELTINFLGNIRKGTALALARRVHKGRRTQVWEVKIRQEGGRGLLALASGTFFIFPPQN